jgi:osmotically-inducible protein OsmY
MLGVASGAAVGAALEYFLDPSSGRRRRRVSVDRTAGIARRAWRRGSRLERAAGARGAGLIQRARHHDETPKELDDATLAHKVETVLFRSPDVPKGQININAQRGVVQLRGELASAELIDELVARTRTVQGVRDVENLLHLPGARAPMHA